MDAQSDISRKGFFANLFMKIGVLAGLGFLGARLLQYIFPVVEKLRTVEIPVADQNELAEGGAKVIALGSLNALLIRTGGGYKAFSRICTHLDCIVAWHAEQKKFICPCHNGHFDIEGNVVKGPPPRPLQRYEVVTKEGKVWIRYETRETYV